MEKRRHQLLGILKKHGISVSEGAALRVNQYHPPSAPNWCALTQGFKSRTFNHHPRIKTEVPHN